MKKLIFILLLLPLLIFSQSRTYREKIIDAYDISEGDTVFNWNLWPNIESWNIHIKYELDTIGQVFKILQCSKPSCISSEYSFYPNLDSLITDVDTGNVEFQDSRGFAGEFIQIKIDTTGTPTGIINAWILFKIK